MIGGITANVACSPFFEEGNVDPNFYLFLRESVLGPDAIMGIAVSLASIDPETDKYLDINGSLVIRELYVELLKAYVTEAVGGESSHYPIVDIDFSSNDIYAKLVEEFKIVSLSGALLAGTNCKEELDVVVNAQRAVGAITNSKDYIKLGIQLALMYYELNRMGNESGGNHVVAKKEFIKEMAENICYPLPLKNWEYFNLSGLGEIKDPKLIVSAMFASVLDAENYEDCLRKAGSCFHHSSYLSFSAGLLGEKIFGVPTDMSNDGYSFLSKSPSLYDVVAEFESEFPPNLNKKRSFIKRNF